MLSKLSLTLALLTTALTAHTAPLESRQSSCAPLIHLHAAGTGETGLGIVGNAFASKLPWAIPGASVRAITYSTSAEYVVSVQAGARTAATQIQSIVSTCPDSKISLSGYSKGAMVMHNIQVPAAVQAKIVSVSVFGDPLILTGSNGIPLTNKQCFTSACKLGDIFCSAVKTSIIPHLAYPTDGSVDKAVTSISSCFNA